MLTCLEDSDDDACCRQIADAPRPLTGVPMALESYRLAPARLQALLNADPALREDLVADVVAKASRKRRAPTSAINALTIVTNLPEMPLDRVDPVHVHDLLRARTRHEFELGARLAWRMDLPPAPPAPPAAHWAGPSLGGVPEEVQQMSALCGLGGWGRHAGADVRQCRAAFMDVLQRCVPVDGDALSIVAAYAQPMALLCKPLDQSRDPGHL